MVHQLIHYPWKMAPNVAISLNIFSHHQDTSLFFYYGLKVTPVLHLSSALEQDSLLPPSASLHNFFTHPQHSPPAPITLPNPIALPFPFLQDADLISPFPHLNIGRKSTRDCRPHAICIPFASNLPSTPTKIPLLLACQCTASLFFLPPCQYHFRPLFLP